jgi:hypothetical protein
MTKIGYFCVDLTCAFGVSFCAPLCASPGVTPCEGPRAQASRTKVYHSQWTKVYHSQFISRTGVAPDARRQESSLVQAPEQCVVGQGRP